MLAFYSGSTCPGEQVLADSGKVVFLSGPCEFVLKRNSGIPPQCGYLYLCRKKEQENHSKKRSWRGIRLAIIRPWVTNKSATSDTQIIPEILCTQGLWRSRGNFVQRAPSMSVSDSQGPALLAEGGQRGHVWCSKTVVKCSLTATCHGQELPNTATVLLSKLSSRLCHCKNLNKYIFAAHVVLSLGCCLKKCWGMGNK